MTSISDLPTEIVVEVTSHLAGFDDDAYRISLALTCRRFYNAIIHSVLVEQIKQIENLSSHSRIVPPLYNSTDGSRIGPGSEIVLFQRKFDNIRFIVGDMTRKELQSLRCFVCRSDRLRRVEIHLLATKRCSLKDVARLIGACAAKPDLSLRIFGHISGRLESPFRFDFHPPNDADPRPKPSIKTDTTNPPLTFYSVTRPKNDFNENSFPKAQLYELSLHGEFPFLLPLYPVIIHCLNSPITTLSISGVPPSITLFHWNQILPSITLPNLKNLTLEKLLIAFPDLLAFLERHQTIKTLDLTENNVIGVVRLPPRAILPRLFSLTANAEYLLPFIQHKKQGYFPSLEFLYANPCSNSRNPDEFLPLYASLSEQGHHFKLCLGVAAQRTLGLIQWLLVQDADHASRNKPTKKSSSPTSTPLACVRQLTISDPSLSASPEIAMRLSKRFDGRHASLREMLDEDELTFIANSEKLIEVLLWTTCLHLTSVKIGSRQSTRDWRTSRRI